ncbi:VOC family protein [Tautonia sociabilis]|uniref:VOC family protein n=1 Tax=Tautonia sociabilis TaxID=2080755 RepID=A0A432MK84_9BACT|nr:VOC family protein [Tautonia sociabilis]RUL87670.1 VOC family protein [Tautonia sociabilis]
MTLFMTEIHAGDPVRLAEWYARTLGLLVSLRDEPKGFVLLEAPEGGRLAIKRREDATERPKGMRLVFQVKDVGEQRDRLLGLGVAVGEQAENLEERYREVRLSDPEGTPITIFSWSDRPEGG